MADALSQSSSLLQQQQQHHGVPSSPATSHTQQESSHQPPRRMSPLHLATQDSAANNMNNRMNPQIDANILSRMVTATGGAGMPIRVATMSDFRRSVGIQRQQQIRGPNQAFNLQNMALSLSQHRASLDKTSSNNVTGGLRGPSENPMLRLMEERMAAAAAAKQQHGQEGIVIDTPTASPSEYRIDERQKRQQLSPTYNKETNAALQASINKWAGLGHQAEVQNITSKPPQTRAQSTHCMSKQNESKMMETVHEQGALNESFMMNSVPKTSSANPMSSQTMQLQQEKQQTLLSRQQQIIQQMLFEQNGMLQQAQHLHPSSTRRVSPNDTTSASPQQQPQPSLTRCAKSLAEVDRLRRENQTIQYQQQIAMQERSNEQFYLRQRSIAASVLASSNNNGQGLTQEKLNQVQSEMNAAYSLASMKKSGSTASLRGKRRSLTQYNNDDEEDDSTAFSSGTHTTPSLSSHASSYKAYRSLSYCGSRASFTGSMENLRIKSPFARDGGSMGDTKNQSFSSGLNTAGVQNQSFAFGLDTTTTKNQSFSSGLNSSQLNFVNLLLSSSQNEVVLPVEQEATPPLSRKPSIGSNQSQSPATSVCFKKSERMQSSIADTVIISELPDRIRYQNADAEIKPIDVVKQALASRGLPSETKPTSEMYDDFFVKSTVDHCQEAVDAIRSSNVEKLRELASGGTNFQCANRFGESLIHLACRRSHRSVIGFLINEGGVSLRVRDDYDRNPLHDACWRPEQDLELLELLIEKEPQLLMLSDKRGHTPLDYARRSHWEVLIPFLLERTSAFQPVW